jgi:hypothetical protein
MKKEEAFDIYKGGTPRPGNKRKQPKRPFSND